MNAKQIISELNARGAKFVVNTNIMYGRGINGEYEDDPTEFESTHTELININ